MQIRSTSLNEFAPERETLRIVTFKKHDRAPRLGAQLTDYILDLPETYQAYRRHADNHDAAAVNSASFDPLPTNALDFLNAGEAAWRAATQAIAFAREANNLPALEALGLAYPADEVTYLPPITRPGKIVCLGQNYRDHITEMKRELPKYPVLFAKFANTLVGHRQPIVLPRVSQMTDYEAELVIVVGRCGKDIPAAAAFDYIYGYTIFNDVSVRDYQRRTSQFLPGKTFDTAGPIGPTIVSKDEVSDPQKLDITLRLNGAVMQQGNTADFIFDIPTMIEHLSEIMTLEPGDLIATGTPAGVGFARDPQVFLQAGDTVEIEISELGMLQNPVVAAS